MNTTNTPTQTDTSQFINVALVNKPWLLELEATHPITGMSIVVRVEQHSKNKDQWFVYANDTFMGSFSGSHKLAYTTVWQTLQGAVTATVFDLDNIFKLAERQSTQYEPPDMPAS